MEATEAAIRLKRITIVVLFCSVFVTIASVAVLHKFIPVQALFLVGILSFTAIAVVLLGRPGAEWHPKRYEAGLFMLVWPLLLGGIVFIFGVWRHGWNVDDVIGATVWVLLMAGYFHLYRRRKRGGRSRDDQRETKNGSA